ncbi:hypothetical protein BDV25DRAFT_162423 [Aspergillus avenaceus]|uniref:Uncharacterized protein n=1 Tax=Aspergillus avenaceus TaxID=36643 RepID=A0A5N6TJE7_ASPAV|nr:hypothetical protein BDV25DRAFT_162423 [Aspergillus avenaceus]
MSDFSLVPGAVLLMAQVEVAAWEGRELRRRGGCRGLAAGTLTGVSVVDGDWREDEEGVGGWHVGRLHFDSWVGFPL